MTDKCRGGPDRTIVWRTSWVRAKECNCVFHQLGSLATIHSAHSFTKYALRPPAWDGTVFESLEILFLECLVHLLTSVEEVTQPSSSLINFSIVSEVMETKLGDVCGWHGARGSLWLWVPLSRLVNTAAPPGGLGYGWDPWDMGSGSAPLRRT